MKKTNKALTYWIATFLLPIIFCTTGCSEKINIEPELLSEQLEELENPETFELLDDPIADAKLQNLLEQYGAVGLAVAVVKGGEIIYTKSLGLKNRARNEPLTNTDIFRIASVSKPFTATAIMHLVEAGELSLDDDVSDLIGFEVRNPQHPNTVITLKMLLSHTSSITDDQKYTSLDVINPEKNSTWADSYADYAPGSGVLYSNLNYNMAGAIIEQVSGMRFDLYIKQHILDPLGLYAGYYVNNLDSDRFADLYFVNSSGQLARSSSAYNPRTNEVENYTIGYDTPVLSPAGGLKISAADLAKFMMMLMGYGETGGVRIISEENAIIMQQPPFPNVTTRALGINTSTTVISGKTLKGHTGSMYGLKSRMHFNPEENFGIIAITNGTTTGATLMNPVVRALYDHFIK